MILGDRLGRERLPLGRPLGRHDDPLAELLAAPGRVEEVRAGNGERARVRLGIGELEDHPRAREPEDDAARALHAGHPEHLRRTAVGVPRRDRVDDVVVSFAAAALGVRLQSDTRSCIESIEALTSDRLLDELEPAIALGCRDEDSFLHDPAHPRIETLGTGDTSAASRCASSVSLTVSPPSFQCPATTLPFSRFKHGIPKIVWGARLSLAPTLFLHGRMPGCSAVTSSTSVSQSMSPVSGLGTPVR